MRRIHVLLLTLLALAPAGPAAAQVEGIYELTRIEGQVMPAVSPDEDGVVVIGSFLVLKADGRYALGMLASLWQQNSVQNRQVEGTWAVESDTVAFQPDEGSDGEPVRMAYTLQEGTLTLRDEHGHAYAYTRQQPAAP